MNSVITSIESGIVSASNTEESSYAITLHEEQYETLLEEVPSLQEWFTELAILYGFGNPQVERTGAPNSGLVTLLFSWEA